MASWLHERYPEEITVVMQHWFDNLEVDDIGFSVTLNFGNNPEVLYIPYDAIITFVDPSVEFGVKFEQTDAASKSGDAAYSIARTTNKKETSEKTDQSSAPRRSSPTGKKTRILFGLTNFANSNFFILPKSSVVHRPIGYTEKIRRPYPIQWPRKPVTLRLSLQID